MIVARKRGELPTRGYYRTVTFLLIVVAIELALLLARGGAP